MQNVPHLRIWNGNASGSTGCSCGAVQKNSRACSGNNWVTVIIHHHGIMIATCIIDQMFRTVPIDFRCFLPLIIDRRSRVIHPITILVQLPIWNGLICKWVCSKGKPQRKQPFWCAGNSLPTVCRNAICSYAAVGYKIHLPALFPC